MFFGCFYDFVFGVPLYLGFLVSNAMKGIPNIVGIFDEN